VAQEQRIEGDGAFGAQIDGSYNTIIVGVGPAKLELDPKHKRRAKPNDERELLLTELRATDLVGRDEDLAALQAWLDGPMPIAVQCRIGRAGIGKTRLAIELCERAEAAGWTAGFARADELQRFFDAQNLTAWRWSKPTLIVVDYAAASARMLRAWLEVLARRPDGDEPKLRLLLLERHADRQLGWWADLTRPGGLSGRGPDSLIDPTEPVPMHSLHAVEHRRALLANAIAEAARVLGKPAPELPTPGTNPEFDRRLADNALGNEPLYLAMAGRIAIDTGAPEALTLRPGELARLVAGAEENRLRRLAASWNIPAELILHLAACVTLEGGCTRDAAKALIDAERQAVDHPAPPPSVEIAKRLADALPSADGVDAVRPDLIGEAFVLSTIDDNWRSPTEQAAIVERAWRRAGVRVVTTVIRTVQDHAGNDPKHPSLLWFDHLASLTEHPLALRLIFSELPQRTLVLRERAADLTLKLAMKLLSLQAADPDILPLLADSLGSLANRWTDLGLRDDALSAAELAAALYRDIAARWPDAFTSGLATSLSGLANRLSDLGRRDDALAAAEQAAELFRDLAAQLPGAYTPDLATSLNNLADILSGLGRRDDALAAVEQAVALYRHLAAQQPGDFTPGLAASLNDLAANLIDLDRSEDALAATEQAVALSRDLAAQLPDAFTPYLATSLNTLAVNLGVLDRRDDALAAAEQSVALHRDLAADRPDAFIPGLAVSLNTLAGSLSRLGRHGDALSAAEQTVALYDRLATRYPAVFTANLAGSLNNLAIKLSSLDRHQDALDTAEEAVTIRRYLYLVAQRPEVFRPDLARSLEVLADCHEALGDIENALRANSEAIIILRRSFLQYPQASRTQMRRIIGQYLQRSKQLGREPAMPFAGVLTEILQKLKSEEKSE
jgi:tetratricopeptide (TPR) repeat protein